MKYVWADCYFELDQINNKISINRDMSISRNTKILISIGNTERLINRSWFDAVSESCVAVFPELDSNWLSTLLMGKSLDVCELFSNFGLKFGREIDLDELNNVIKGTFSKSPL